MAKQTKTFDDGTFIYNQGDPSDCAYEVLSGNVELLRDDGDGLARSGVAQPGQIFGEMGLVGGGPRDNAARAAGPVKVRIIQSDGAGDAAAKKPRKSMLGRLIEQLGAAVPAVPELPSETTPDMAAPDDGVPSTELGFFQRVIDHVQPLEGRIEARVALLSGDADGAITKQVVAAFDRFRDIHARLDGKPLEVNFEKNLTTELGRAAKIARRRLRGRQADVLIWGYVSAPGHTVHLHFIPLATWDERVPGDFDLTTDLPLPVTFDQPHAEFLRAATLAATVPTNRLKARMRQDMLIEAAAQIATVETLPADLTAREKAAYQLCHGNIHAATWAAARNTDALERAITAYRAVTETVKMEGSPLDWAMAHKHLSNLMYLRTEGDPTAPGFDESAASALSALEVFSREETPFEWAALQHRLGVIHYKLGFENGHTGVLRQALRCHQNALRVYQKHKTPDRWAEVMSNFARAAQVFGEHVKSLEAMATAANAYHAVAQVRDKVNKPLAWAATQNNLGSALFLLGRKANNPDRIQSAIEAFEGALEVYESREKHRLAAVTAKNLDRARRLLEHVAPDDYMPRDLIDIDGPFSEQPERKLVDFSDIGADRTGNSSFH